MNISKVVKTSASNIRGDVVVTIDIDSNTDIIKVEYYVNELLNATIAEEPFSWIWNTGDYPDTTYNLKAYIYSDNGEIGLTKSVEVTINHYLAYLQDFTGYTVTDSSGNVITEDEYDWCSPGFSSSSGGGMLPEDNSFGYAYPNPAIDYIIIPYALANSGSLNLYILDGYGIKVKTCVDGYQSPGYHCYTWDLTNDNGELIEPGLYRCIIENYSEICFGDILITQ